MTGIRFTRSHLKYTSWTNARETFCWKNFLYKIFPVSCGFMTCLIYPCFVVDHWLFVSHVFCFPSKFLVPFSFRFYVKELFKRLSHPNLHHSDSRNSLKSGKKSSLHLESAQVKIDMVNCDDGKKDSWSNFRWTSRLLPWMRLDRSKVDCRNTNAPLRPLLDVGLLC